MGYGSSPIQWDDYSVVMSASGLLVLCLEPYCTRMLSGCNKQKRVRLSTLVDRTLQMLVMLLCLKLLIVVARTYVLRISGTVFII